MRIGLAALLFIPAAVAAQGPSVFSRSEEIGLAKSAAPPAVAKDARVYVLDQGHYVVAEPGRTGEACVLIRIPAAALEPECGDAEADATVLAVERFRVEQRVAGRSPAEIDRAVTDAMAAGRLRAPKRPAMVYMMSSAQVLYDDTTRIGKWRPHIMMYYPFLRESDLGLPAGGDSAVKILGILKPGTPLSALIVVMPTFVEPAPAS
jgi:hypothetical protein